MLQLPVHDRLSFPAAVAPGFDPTHPAARGFAYGLGLSAISSGNNFINLLNGQPGTGNGSGTKIIDKLGGATFFDNSQVVYVRFTNGVSNTSEGTLACIAQFTFIGAGEQILCANAEGGGIELGLVSGAVGCTAANISFNNSSFTPTVNVPYFFATSFRNGVSVDFCITDLSTGKVVTLSQGASGMTTGTNFVVGNGNGHPPGAYIAAAMYSPRAMPLSELRAWGHDPWSFWYPRQLDPPSFLAGLLSGTTFPKLLTATCTTTASLLKRVGKPLLATCTSASTLLKSVGKSLLATCTSAATVLKSVPKTLLATCTTSLPVATALKVILKTLTATCTSTASMLKSVGKPLLATCTSTSALIRTISTHLLATCTSTASVIKRVGKILLAVCTTTLIPSAIKGGGTLFTQTVIATCTSTASSLRSIGKPLLATCTSTATLLKSVGKPLLATCTSTATLIKSVGKTLLATCTTSLPVTLARKTVTTVKTLIATCTTSGLFSTFTLLASAAISIAEKLRPYKPLPPPVIPGSDTLYLLNELQKVSNAFNAHIEATKDLDARLKAAGF